MRISDAFRLQPSGSGASNGASATSARVETAASWQGERFSRSGDAVVMPGLAKHGDTGAAVSTLQRRLGITADGVFGPQTEAAVRRFQQQSGLVVDGVVGPQTWGALLGKPAKPQRVPAPVGSGDSPLAARLLANRSNPHLNSAGQCFRYVWDWVKQTGGQTVHQAPVSTAGRGTPLARMGELEARGILKVGDVIYANNSPGADPSSTNLAYGPHWFMYLGQGRFADQHTIRSASEMAGFVPGRLVDEIFRPFGKG